MSSLPSDASIKDFQRFIAAVYGVSNDRYFSVQDMFTNVERFITRALKGIRKGDAQKTKLNLEIALSWFASLMNQLHIDIEDEIWRRFPYLCSYCGSCPCVCKAKKVQTRQPVVADEAKRPKTLRDFQKMFEAIYPASGRTLDHAGVHLVEEMGEVAEAIFTFRGNHKDEDFQNLRLESADLFSCLMGVFNSLGVDLAQELAAMYSNDCFSCHAAPCRCDFANITRFES
jgi:NTP pyrophosphatase (non-canonical NTP hydrolase)